VRQESSRRTPGASRSFRALHLEMTQESSAREPSGRLPGVRCLWRTLRGRERSVARVIICAVASV
jgi:hypothetical protein